MLLSSASLRHLVVGDVYPKDQLDALRDRFRGDTLIHRGESLRGDLADVAVGWRAPVHSYL